MAHNIWFYRYFLDDLYHPSSEDNVYLRLILLGRIEERPPCSNQDRSDKRSAASSREHGDGDSGHRLGWSADAFPAPCASADLQHIDPIDGNRRMERVRNFRAQWDAQRTRTGCVTGLSWRAAIRAFVAQVEVTIHAITTGLKWSLANPFCTPEQVRIDGVQSAGKGSVDVLRSLPSRCSKLVGHLGIVIVIYIAGIAVPDDLRSGLR